MAMLAVALTVQASEPTAVPETAPLGAESAGTAVGAIEPAFVRALMPIETGRNDSNPVWSPNGELLAFERARGDDKEIVIARLDGSIVQTVYHQAEVAPGKSQFFFPGVVEKSSYNAGLSWSPRGERFVFMSNAGEGNYDLYLRETDGRTPRLTDDKEKDGHAQWSPSQDRVAFISGRNGKGNVYLLELPTAKSPASTTALTRGDHSYLYPQWSPDGKRIAVIRGTNENHDIYLLDAERRAPPAAAPAPKALSSWRYDDLRPTWSPDGKRIAFYTNYNALGDPKVWAIAVVAADGSDPTAGEGLAARIVATGVIPDVEVGPAWMPDGKRIVYARSERRSYYPMHVVDVDSRADTELRTGTDINHDIVCSRNGVIAFRAQVNQWDQIFVMKLKD